MLRLRTPVNVVLPDRQTRVTDQGIALLRAQLPIRPDGTAMIWGTAERYAAGDYRAWCAEFLPEYLGFQPAAK